MTQRENDRKLAELDRLLNDPTTPFDAARIWALAGELRGIAPPQATAPPAPR